MFSLDKINNAWKRYSALGHLAGLAIVVIFTAGATWAAATITISKIKEDVTAQGVAIENQQGSIIRLERNLAYLMGRFKIPYNWNAEKE